MAETNAPAAKSQLGSFAIAAAIIIAACAFGFVSSKAFAIFILYLVGASLLAGIGISFLSLVDKIGWIASLVPGLLFLGAMATLVSGIDEALGILRAS